MKEVVIVDGVRTPVGNHGGVFRDVEDAVESAEEIGYPVIVKPIAANHGRGQVHRAALADLIARLSVLADDHPEMSSVELNPVNAWTGGVDVLGADVVVRPALVRKDPGRRRMT